MGYRDADEALRSRLARHRERLAELDGAAPASSRRLPRRLRRRLASLRERAQLGENGAHALACAERAADAYEQTLDEALGLGAELAKSLRSPWPEPAVLARWMAFGAASLVIVGIQLHVTDFLWRAPGAHVGTAHPDLTGARIFFELDASIARKAPSPSGVRPVETEQELLERIVEEQRLNEKAR